MARIRKKFRCRKAHQEARHTGRERYDDFLCRHCDFGAVSRGRVQSHARRVHPGQATTPIELGAVNGVAVKERMGRGHLLSVKVRVCRGKGRPGISLICAFAHQSGSHWQRGGQRAPTLSSPESCGRFEQGELKITRILELQEKMAAAKRARKFRFVMPNENIADFFALPNAATRGVRAQFVSTRQ
uniref:C2H2-type domain-containing protein n=1 Tax=Globodera rostochiensis TaxID=31243 RepID=A0A914HMD3_GLORO